MLTAALAIPPAVIPAGFATRLHWPLTGDARLLTDAIEALTDFAVGPEPLDARIFRALGWQVERRPVRRGRPPVWWVKSPYSATWQALPRPSLTLTDTRRLVPDGWSWGTGMRGGHAHGWVSARHPIREGVPFFECNGLSPELALSKAALFARRHLAMKREGLAA
jgi:hypothetical protein